MRCKKSFCLIRRILPNTSVPKTSKSLDFTSSHLQIVYCSHLSFPIRRRIHSCNKVIVFIIFVRSYHLFVRQFIVAILFNRRKFSRWIILILIQKITRFFWHYLYQSAFFIINKTRISCLLSFTVLVYFIGFPLVLYSNL